MLESMTEWQDLRAAFDAAGKGDLRAMFAADPARAERMTVEAAGLTLDYSKNLVDDALMPRLLALCDGAKLRDAIDAMFSGAVVNETEGRSVLHVALRNRANTPIEVDGKDVMPEINEVLAKMGAFAERVPTSTLCTFPIRLP